jgi:hypothetical protein
MFVGYNIDSKAYKLVDYAIRKIKLSRDVIFNEITPTMGFKTSALQDNEKGIGAVEVNQNPMLCSILENNGEAKATSDLPHISIFVLKEWVCKMVEMVDLMTTSKESRTNNSLRAK